MSQVTTDYTLPSVPTYVYIFNRIRQEWVWKICLVTPSEVQNLKDQKKGSNQISIVPRGLSSTGGGSLGGLGGLNGIFRSYVAIFSFETKNIMFKHHNMSSKFNF